MVDGVHLIDDGGDLHGDGGDDPKFSQLWGGDMITVTSEDQQSAQVKKCFSKPSSSCSRDGALFSSFKPWKCQMSNVKP